MQLKQETTLPNEIKRGGITELDRKMVYKNMSNGKYTILFSNAETDKLYIAHAYYQMNIALRMMSRLVEGKMFTSTQMTDGVITHLLDNILISGWTNTFKQIAPETELLKAERLIFKCYRYCMLCEDFFELLPLIKSYCLEVVKVPEVQLKAYLKKGVRWRKKSELSALYDSSRLFGTREFIKLPDKTRESWITYIVSYDKNNLTMIKPEEKLLAIRDHAVDLVEENGEAYNFLVKACKELLL